MTFTVSGSRFQTMSSFFGPFLIVAMLFCPFSGLHAGERPRLEVPVITTAPMIDGDLSDPVWSRAGKIPGLIEVDPDEGAPGTPPTEILIMRDRTHLYVGFICHEPEMDRIVLNDMHRDAWQEEDEAVKIVLDTFRDGKSGYYFLLDAAGSRLDALVSDNGQRVNYSWDGFWEARARCLDGRWTGEFAIPFKTLAFGEDGIWRANFERWRGVDRTRYRWTGTSRAFRVTTMSEGGELYGLDGLEQGLGLEIVPYLKVKRTRRHEPRSQRLTGDLGGEIVWRATPQLVGSFTANTDFAETEADARMVNLTRFPLFFPEKRDFFLQDATQFEFGWESPFNGSPNVLPFFSRRIGLSPGGEEIPIEYGGRVTGRVGDLGLGLLAVHTGADASEGIPAGDLFVARPALRVTDEWTVGGILTQGDPASREQNWVGGGDIRYATTEHLPGLLSINAYFLRSADEGTHQQGTAYGFGSTLKTDDWYGSLNTLYAQDRFHPALGFVRRPGERRYQGQLQWEPRPDEGRVRNYTFSHTATLWTRPDGTLLSRTLSTRLFQVRWHDGDLFYFDHASEYDRLDADFEPVEKSVIPAGEYDWQSLTAGLAFSQVRPLSGRLSVKGGGWYNGRSVQFQGETTWNPLASLELGLEYSENQVRLPGNDFTTRVESLRVNYDFSNDVRAETLVQADNVSDNLGLQARLRWIEEDGRELFFVVNSSWLQEQGGALVPVEHDLTVKIQYAFRF